MKTCHRIWLALFLSLAAAVPSQAARKQVDPDDLLKEAIFHWMDLAQPIDAASARTVSVQGKLTRAAGLPGEATGASLDASYQWPDKLRAAVTVAGEVHQAGRDGQQLWVHQPAKKFGLVAKSGVPRFTADPASIDQTVLPPFELPIGKLKMRGILLAVEANHAGQEKVGEFDCTILKVKVMNLAAERLGNRRLDDGPGLGRIGRASEEAIEEAHGGSRINILPGI